MGLREEYVTHKLRAEIRVQNLTEINGLKMCPVDALFPCGAFCTLLFHFCRFPQE